MLLNNAPLVTLVHAVFLPNAASVPARGSHTDLVVPDFSAYRNDHTKRANERASRGELGKKAAGYVMLGGEWKCLKHISIVVLPLPLPRTREQVVLSSLRCL